NNLILAHRCRRGPSTPSTTSICIDRSRLPECPRKAAAYGSLLSQGRPPERYRIKNGRDWARPFSLRDRLSHRGGAVPGGGGGSDAVPPLSKGVMRRMVTRRLMRLGPSVCSLRYCSP